MSSSFIEQAKQYASYHTKPATRYTHFVGIPLIIFSSLIFLGFFHLSLKNIFTIDFGWLLSVVLLAYYFKLEWRLALSLTPILALFNYLAGFISSSGPNSATMTAFIVIFAIGWICQLAGHFFEKKRPAFMDNLSQALIAPLFLMAELYFCFGKFHQLHDEMYSQQSNPAEPDET